MTDTEGPWGHRRPGHRVGPRVWIIIWLAALIGIALMIWKLDDLFPGRIDSDFDQAQLVKLVAILAVVSATVIFGRRIKFGLFVRYVLIWLGIATVPILGFTFQDEIKDVLLRVRSELIPGYPVTTDPTALVLYESPDGHFRVIGRVNGTPVTFLIDTGASGIVLSPSDAKRVGIDMNGLSFVRVYETANGLGRGAPFSLTSMSIGPIELSNVPASINQSDMRDSLLGMSFLKQMASFEIQGRKLTLRWR
jgi:aspartyl protease family protein